MLGRRGGRAGARHRLPVGRFDNTPKRCARGRDALFAAFCSRAGRHGTGKRCACRPSSLSCRQKRFRIAGADRDGPLFCRKYRRRRERPRTRCDSRRRFGACGRCRTAPMTPSPNVKITRDGAVLCVTFDRPDKKNAINRAMYMAATDALRQADSDRAIGAVVFTGSGGVFTAGNDIADFLEASAELGEFPAFTFIKALAACETPLVAAIEGMVVGIGATMMLHCDLVYAAPDATFGLPFVDLGLVPEAASSLFLPRRVGMAKAAELLLLCEPFDAEDAVRFGFANAIVPACELRDFAMERAGHLAT